jgi:hypothetical protein
MSLPTSGTQHEQEIIMIKLHASFARKIPGQQEYSSDSASASVEVELADNDTAHIPAKLAELWDIARSAVEQQLGQRQPPVNRIPGNGNGQNGNGGYQQRPSNDNGQPAGNGNYPPRNNGGNGRSKSGISDKQKGFVKSLIGELRPLGCDFSFVESLCQRLFQRGLDYLDRAQASTLIGHLSEIKAGRVTVQQLAA